MSAGFDSLNVATASGIALFHASRFAETPPANS
jgi:tRNA G18 (ribose-2'-O)-methylase SpoU